MESVKSVEQANVRNKRVVVRVDWNVTIGQALQIVDDTRIVRTLPTIKFVLERGATQVILLAHLGKAEEKRSLEPVVRYAEKIVGEEIELFKDWESLRIAQTRISMLENLRLWEGEEQNDLLFSRKLADLGDIYVDEAFGEAHRKVASIVGITRYLPSFAGLWFVDEVETILKVKEQAKHPLVVVMGGAKVEDKIKLLGVMSEIADVILLGGKLANEFVNRGMKLPGEARIITPIEGANLLDIGTATIEKFASEIAKAKTVIWNGPMGRVEDPKLRVGTEAIYEAITANQEAYTLVGGGDTLAAIGQERHLTSIDHVSTGGGAMLKLLESGSLPGIAALASK